MDYSNAKEIFSKINLELSEKEFLDFTRYQKLLIEWNEKINLTAITEDKDVWIKHFADSCTLIPILSKYSNNKNFSLIDVGTGAGFPSIPLKIINNDIDITMLDSLNKRINFLNEVIAELDFTNILAIHGRSEEVSHDTRLRERFDFATARAVANLSTLLEYCLPFVKVNGYFICMKGSMIEKEESECKKALKILGGEIIEKIKLNLPLIKDERNILVIKKIKNTPNEYSRKAGIPSRKPL